MDFRTFARTLTVHWKLLVGALLACLAGAAAVTAFQTRAYESSATVLISFPGQTDPSQLYYGTQAAQDRLPSYAAIAGGRAIAARAVAHYDLPISAEALVSKTRVLYIPKSLMFTITVTDTDPNRAAALTKAMADEFVEVVGTLGVNPKGTLPPPPSADGQPAPQPQTIEAIPTRATVVEPATVPKHPISPVPTRNMGLGLVAGILLGVGVALTREATDHSVRDREKLERLCNLPTLAELPGRRGTAPRFGTDIAFDDAVRGLRARMLRAAGPGASRVVVTAPFGGEGTTTTALNLAKASAEAGEDVLLVEGDTRRPVIAGLLKVESGEGLASALANPEIAVEVVKATPIPKLFMLAPRAARRDTLPCSSYQPEVLDNVMQELSATFSRTIIDGPPVLATADSGMLAGAVHATVLVVRARRTTEEELADALTALNAAGARVIGTVLTDAKVARHTRAAAKAYRAKLGG
ncbi:chain length determinant protein [Mycobacterium lentiflavum]|uniref:Chain length determinant protein n=1 Tax=Mycobacterium lentiflavum TaxID=141349 RepID=A0A0E4H0Q0_MYCLN|nr:polysaccharide biosynthesis tyrosine autokinase [Mycobacterium lentiflavum]MEE3065411.1 Wzz/FepE/Etk N-terminal domain-containing protein [Actinomycetota bacterium]ULP41491.1 chain-length determining protein [Mycobacterium lentiflavum]CQD20078.1 chain length determinant protein [Mycobacterium lentiflavum]